MVIVLYLFDTLKHTYSVYTSYLSMCYYIAYIFIVKQSLKGLAMTNIPTAPMTTQQIKGIAIYRKRRSVINPDIVKGVK